MSSNPKWDTPLTLTAKEYFKTPFLIPHEGFVRLVRELEMEIGKDKTHRIVAKVRDDCARDFALRMGGRKYESFGEFIKALMPALRSQLRTSTADGYTEDSPEYALISNYTSCIFHEIYKEWDALDIGFLWSCMLDYTMVNAFCEQASFERPESLMKGDEICKFCWKWEEEKKTR